MTDPKTPENKPEAPKPGASSGPYISSRLREKLMETDDKEWTPKTSNPLPGILATAGMVAVLVLTFMWVQSSSKKQAAEKAEAARKAEIADSIATAARAESLATVARADSAARADSILAHGGKLPTPGAATASKPAATKPAATAGGATAAAEPAAKPAPATDGFGISVGQYMMESRANSELEKLSGTTGLAGKVVPVDDGGSTMYRVILGRWSSRGPAEARATALIDSSLVREARVVARPK